MHGDPLPKQGAVSATGENGIHPPRGAASARRLNWRRRRPAISLVDVLSAIAIVGALVVLTMPALHAARESARLTNCRSNVHQLAIAVDMHEAAHTHYPTGGWGYAWLGDPDRGFGKRQPGGWIYSVLPFLDESALRSMGRDEESERKNKIAGFVSRSGLQLCVCPSRRSGFLVRHTASTPPRNGPRQDSVASSDYAINAGTNVAGLGPGPKSIVDGDRVHRWPRSSQFSGMSYLRSELRPTHVSDGLANTYLLGEKHVVQNGADIGNDQSMYSGYDYDSYRWTKLPPRRDGRHAGVTVFGSSHANGVVFAFADGSVHLVSYYVDREVHRRAGHRSDGG